MSERQEQWVYGPHAVSALLAHRHRPALRLYLQQDRTDQRMLDLMARATANNLAMEFLPLKVMDQRFDQGHHQGMVALAGPLPHYTERDLDKLLDNSHSPALILILDGVTDPHNLGACLRSADGSGVDFVIIPKDKSATITPVVSHVACGAAESVPMVRVTNLVRAMEQLKAAGIWIYGASDEASQTLYTLDAKTPMALVMGSEGEGLRRLTRDHCDGLYSIPMRGSVSSLNVSVATAVSLYEVVRQRQTNVS